MKQFRPSDDLIVNIYFTSRTFSALARIVAIRPADNQLDVELIPSDGFAWVEKNWNLEHTKWAFQNGDYIKENIDEAQRRLNDKNYHII